MGFCDEGVEKDKSDGAGTRNSLYGSGTDGIFLWEKELGGDMSNDKRAGGLPPLGVQADCGEVGLVYGGQRVGMTPNGR